MLPPDAGKHPVRARPSRRISQLCNAIRPRYGNAPGGEIRGHVRQPLHRGLRGAGAKGRAEAAGSGARGRADPQPRSGRVCTVKKLTLLCFVAALAYSQSPDSDPKQRARAVRDLAKQGEDGVAKLSPYLGDIDLNVRVEAVKALVEIGGPKTLDALVRAAGDNDPEIQIRATDGLANLYLPGYVKTGLSGSLQRVGNSVRGK